jgi:hypothetical protein
MVKNPYMAQELGQTPSLLVAAVMESLGVMASGKSTHEAVAVVM